MGQAKLRGSFNKRKAEGILRRIQEHQQWESDRARRIAEDCDPLVTKAIRESIADYGGQLFKTPKAKVKRWK
jgi:ribosomal protein S17E